MTPSSPRTAQTVSGLPRARKRRVKRGIVAGYIHDISPRHRPAAPVAGDARPVTALPTIEITPLTAAAEPAAVADAPAAG